MGETLERGAAIGVWRDAKEDESAKETVGVGSTHASESPAGKSIVNLTVDLSRLASEAGVDASPACHAVQRPSWSGGSVLSNSHPRKAGQLGPVGRPARPPVSPMETTQRRPRQEPAVSPASVLEKHPRMRRAAATQRPTVRPVRSGRPGPSPHAQEPVCKVMTSAHSSGRELARQRGPHARARPERGP